MMYLRTQPHSLAVSMAIALLLCASVVHGQGQGQRTVNESERGLIFTQPSNGEWDKAGIMIGHMESSSNITNDEVIKVPHGRFHYFNLHDDPYAALFPFREFDAFNRAELDAGYPSVMAMGRLPGEQLFERPIYGNMWNSMKLINPRVQNPSEVACDDGLDNDNDGVLDCDDPDCVGYGSCPPQACSSAQSGACYADIEAVLRTPAMKLNDARFVRFWVNNYVRKILHEWDKPNTWVSSDACLFIWDAFGAVELDDPADPMSKGTWRTGLEWDSGVVDQATYLDSVEDFGRMLEEYAPDIAFLCNEASIGDESRFAGIYQDIGGTLREYMNPDCAGFQTTAGRKTFDLIMGRNIALGNAGQVSVLRAPVDANVPARAGCSAPNPASGQFMGIEDAYAIYLLMRGPNHFFAPQDWIDTPNGFRTTGVEASPSGYAQMAADLGKPIAPTRMEPHAPVYPVKAERFYFRETQGGVVFFNALGVDATLDLGSQGSAGTHFGPYIEYMAGTTFMTAFITLPSVPYYDQYNYNPGTQTSPLITNQIVLGNGETLYVRKDPGPPATPQPIIGPTRERYGAEVPLTFTMPDDPQPAMIYFTTDGSAPFPHNPTNPNAFVVAAPYSTTLLGPALGGQVFYDVRAVAERGGVMSHEANYFFDMGVFNSPLAEFHMIDDAQSGGYSNESRSEFHRNHYILVSLDQPADTCISLDYNVLGGSATWGQDFTFGASRDCQGNIAPPGTLYFKPGSMYRTIHLQIEDDLLPEGDETIVLELSNPQGMILGWNTQFTYTLRENDAGPNPVTHKECVVDSGVYSGSATGKSSYIHANQPLNGSGVGPNLLVGTHSASLSDARALVAFDPACIASAHGHIDTAQVTVRANWLQDIDGDDAVPVAFYRLEKDWSEIEANWWEYASMFSWDMLGAEGASDRAQVPLAVNDVWEYGKLVSHLWFDATMDISNVRQGAGHWGYLFQSDTDALKFHAKTAPSLAVRKPRLHITTTAQPPSAPPTSNCQLGAEPSMVVTVVDADANGLLEGADIDIGLQQCQGYGGCVLRIPAGIYEDVALVIGAGYPNGLVIEGDGIGQTILRTGTTPGQAPVLFKIDALQAPDGIVFRHLSLDGNKENLQLAYPWQGPGLQHSGINTRTGFGVTGGNYGLICDTEIYGFIDHGVYLANVEGWTVTQSSIHDIGCQTDFTSCSPSINAWPNVGEQTAFSCDGTASGLTCSPGGGQCPAGQACQGVGYPVGGLGECVDANGPTGPLCSALASNSCASGEICRGLGMLGRKRDGFPVLISSSNDNIIEGNVFWHGTKYIGVYGGAICGPKGDHVTPWDNVFRDNIAFSEAVFMNNGGCATVFENNTVEGSHTLRNECPFGCSTGAAFGCRGGGQGTVFRNNYALNNGHAGFSVACSDGLAIMEDNIADSNCLNQTTTLSGVPFPNHQYETAGEVFFRGNNSWDPGANCAYALQASAPAGLTVEGGSHDGAQQGILFVAGSDNLVLDGVMINGVGTGAGVIAPPSANTARYPNTMIPNGSNSPPFAPAHVFPECIGPAGSNSQMAIDHLGNLVPNSLCQ